MINNLTKYASIVKDLYRAKFLTSNCREKFWANEKEAGYSAHFKFSRYSLGKFCRCFLQAKSTDKKDAPFGAVFIVSQYKGNDTLN